MASYISPQESFPRECNNCYFLATSYQQLCSHTETDHNICSTCGAIFKQQGHLIGHKCTHAPRKIICFGCRKKYKSYSGMLIHLEYGTCRCGIDQADLDLLAVQCYQSRKYVKASCRDWLLGKPKAAFIWVDENHYWNCVPCGCYFEGEDEAGEHIVNRGCRKHLPFECPGCKRGFRFLSAMVAHVEGGRCEEEIKPGSTVGRLLHFLHWNVSTARRWRVRRWDRGVLI